MNLSWIKPALDIIPGFVAPSASWISWPPSFIPKDNYQGRKGFVRSLWWLVMSPASNWWRTHYFFSKILRPFHWHPPIFFCRSNHSITLFSRFHFFVVSFLFCLANQVSGCELIFVYLFQFSPHRWPKHCDPLQQSVFALNGLLHHWSEPPWGWPQLDNHQHHAIAKEMRSGEHSSFYRIIWEFFLNVFKFRWSSQILFVLTSCWTAEHNLDDGLTSQ